MIGIMRNYDCDLRLCRDPAGECSGLGLSDSFDCKKKHNGKVIVQSELGSFAEFTVLLPALQHLDREKD